VVNKYLRLILFKVIKPLFKMTEEQKSIKQKYEQEKRVLNQQWGGGGVTLLLLLSVKKLCHTTNSHFKASNLKRHH
jgi:di/tricarboxylate transporter